MPRWALSTGNSCMREKSPELPARLQNASHLFPLHSDPGRLCQAPAPG